MDKEESQFFKEAARQDLLSFCVYNDKFFDIIEHHELIASYLDKLMNDDIQNLMICMPPRAWKSRIMQEFISFLLGRLPNNDVLYTGHSLSLLEDFSRNIRNRINSQEYKNVFSTEIAGDNSAVKSWKINKGWVFSIFGVWGWITGKGWNYMIIDDPYATRQDAESDTVRKTVSNWYWSTFLSRKQNDKAKQIIIMQRWREDDLVWEILEREPEKWEVLKIPALNEEWESFWADRFSAEYFEDIRRQNPLFFSSQYQQDPLNQWGWDFKQEYFEYYDEIEDYNRLDIVSFLDPAISQKQEADNTAIVTIWVDRKSNYTYILEVKAFKETPDNIINELFDTAQKFTSVWNTYKAWIEVVQYQKMLALEIKKQMRIRDFFFYLEEVRPQGEKESRIRTALQWRYSWRTVIHPKYWVSDLELELLKFPNWKHDDMIDALASAVWMSQVQSLQQRKPRTYNPSINDFL